MHRMIVALAATAIFVAAACNEHAPILPTEPAPPGVTQVVLAVTADRISLDAGSTTAAIITITARLSDNTPVPDNSEIVLNASLGYFALDGDGKAVQLITVKTTGGVATAQFFAGSEIGTANLLAQLGTSVGKLNLAVNPAPVTPVADFSFDVAGLRVIFTDLSTGPPATRKWTFGDTTDSKDVSPIHDYKVAGTYTVTLEVTNGGGSSIKSKFVTVEPLPPLVPSFTSQVSGLKVLFVDTSTGGPSSWTWDFGDTGTSIEQNPQHTYELPGTYAVTLKIAGGGRSASASAFVIPGGPPPAASFTFEVAGKRTIFTDTSTGAPTSWLWDFGDQSENDKRQNPVHDYEMPGTYTVALTVGNAGGTNTKTQFVPVTLGDAPKAAFTTQIVALDVAFTDASTGNPTAWEWNFGDGSPVDTRQNPTHHYADARTYTVSLKATNSAGSNTATQLITPVAVPLAAFTYSPPSGESLTINFYDLSSGAPTVWQWNFGDCANNSACTSTLQNPVHTYLVPNVYVVTLTAANSAGQDTEEKAIKAGRPQAAFRYDITAPRVVQFTDQSTHNPVTFAWNFGDCPNPTCTSTLQNPVHIYAQGGNYTVTLRVSNAAGDSVVPLQITVP